MLVVLSIGLLYGTAFNATERGRELAIHVALQADFGSKYRCTGDIFKGASGVLFLPSGSVLVAKSIVFKGKVRWAFPKDKCEE